MSGLKSMLKFIPMDEDFPFPPSGRKLGLSYFFFDPNELF